MMKTYRQILSILILIVVVFSPLDASATGKAQALDVTPLKIETTQGSFNYNVELAASIKEQAVGLMYRREMAANHGMIFLNSRVRLNSFWMKNTYIPLDIIFISAEGRVVNIVTNTIPLSLDPVSSTQPVLAVLELNAGQASLIGLSAGDMVYHKIFGNEP